MNKTLQIFLALAGLVLIGILFFMMRNPVEAPTTESLPAESAVKAFDPKNATYQIDGSSVTLIDGVALAPAAPDSASKVTTRYFGNDAKGDLNGDGQDDIAFLITQEGGGSGLFYYAVVALKTKDGYMLTNAFFVGDRIAPQSTEINAREIHVNYAERKAGESMTTPPSQGAVLLLKVTPEGELTGLMR